MLRVPKVHVAGLQCNDRKPDGWYRCNRPAGHTGRHLYAWRNAGPLTGHVRGVWSDARTDSVGMIGVQDNSGPRPAFAPPTEGLTTTTVWSHDGCL